LFLFALGIPVVLSPTYLPRSALLFRYGSMGFGNTVAWGGYWPRGVSSPLADPIFNVTIPTSCERLVVTTRAPENLEFTSPGACLW
jgi:hypothetical protein